MTRWLTIEKAADSTGLPASYFHERTSPTSGVWAEGVVWKWFEGRKLVDLEALYNLIDQAPSVASMRGRRRGAGDQHRPPSTLSNSLESGGIKLSRNP